MRLRILDEGHSPEQKQAFQQMLARGGEYLLQRGYR